MEQEPADPPPARTGQDSAPPRNQNSQQRDSNHADTNPGCHQQVLVVFMQTKTRVSVVGEEPTVLDLVMVNRNRGMEIGPAALHAAGTRKSQPVQAPACIQPQRAPGCPCLSQRCGGDSERSQQITGHKPRRPLLSHTPATVMARGTVDPSSVRLQNPPEGLRSRSRNRIISGIQNPPASSAKSLRT